MQKTKTKQNQKKIRSLPYKTKIKQNQYSINPKFTNYRVKLLYLKYDTKLLSKLSINVLKLQKIIVIHYDFMIKISNSSENALILHFYKEGSGVYKTKTKPKLSNFSTIFQIFRTNRHKTKPKL